MPLIGMVAAMQSPESFRGWVSIYDHHRPELFAEYPNVARGLIMIIVSRYLPQSLLVNREGVIRIDEHSIESPLIINHLRSIQEPEHIEKILVIDKLKMSIHEIEMPIKAFLFDILDLSSIDKLDQLPRDGSHVILA